MLKFAIWQKSDHVRRAKKEQLLVLSKMLKFAIWQKDHFRRAKNQILLFLQKTGLDLNFWIA